MDAPAAARVAGLVRPGDPAGVGPEVICKALADMSPAERVRVRVFGNRDVLARAAKIVGADLDFSERSNGISVDHVPFDGDIPPFGKLDPRAGDASFHYIEKSVRAAQAGEIGCIVTAPINKEALNSAGHH